MHVAVFFKYLRVPLAPAPLLLIATFAILATVARRAGLMGLPLMLIVSSWFFKYSFVLLDHIVDGHREAPVLSAEMVNPVEQRPLGWLLLAGGYYGLTMLLEPYFGAVVVTSLRIGALALVPAMLAAMSVNGRFIDALNPAVVFGIVARIPATYGVLVACIAALWLVPWILVKLTGGVGAPTSLFGTALLLYLWLTTFACVGGIVYERREALDVEPAHTPERRAAKLQAETDRERDRQMDRIFAEVRGGALQNAGARVREIIDRSAAPLDEFPWLYTRAARWPDRRLAEYLVQLWVPRLLAARANGRALELVRERLRQDDLFRLEHGGDALRVAELALAAGDRFTASRILKRFEEHYPGHPAADLAARLSQQVF